MSVPSAIYILEPHRQGPPSLEEAVIRAANDPRDNATVAAIVGAAVGRLHGLGRASPLLARRASGTGTRRQQRQSLGGGVGGHPQH